MYSPLCDTLLLSYWWKKPEPFTTPCKDDTDIVAELKRRISQKWYYFCSPSPKCQIQLKWVSGCGWM